MGGVVRYNHDKSKEHFFVKFTLAVKWAFWKCLPLVCFLLPIQLGSAQPVSVERPSERINRSVLTVGREVYSATDAAALLLIWNLTQPPSEKPVFIQTQWLSGFAVPDLLSFDPTIIEKIWPEDVRVFFQVALIWVDVQKLNLFIPKDQEISSLLSQLNERQASLTGGFESVLIREVLGASEKQRRKWIEMVIRARTFLRVRGGLDRNKNLFNVGWYWHREDVGGLKTK